MSIRRLLATLILFLSLAWPAQAQAPLEQLCAPYALYPDTLLAQVLTASTYPNELQAAQVWCTSNPGLTGSGLATALGSENWDVSVKALCTFPDVVKKMTDNMDATRQLGDTFLADKAEVMDTVQALRARAQTSGALVSNAQQNVVANQDVIQIQPANQSTLYVPMYDPSDLYMGGGALGSGWLGFGTGVALGSAFNANYGAFDWANHGLYTGAALATGAYGGAVGYPGAYSWGHNYSAGGGYGYGAGAAGYQTGSYHGANGGYGNSYRGYAGGTASGYHGANGGEAGGFHGAAGGEGAAYRGPGGATAGAYKGPQGNVAYRGPQGNTGSFHGNSGFESRSASRGWGSMGGGAGHFGGRR